MSQVKKEDSPTQHEESSVQPPSAGNPSESATLSVNEDQTNNRSELLAKARSFLASPQVRHQDTAAKRAFLIEKGLHDSEIKILLQSQALQPPLIPPRTYPLPPPSNLPVLLLGLVRLFSWLTGSVAILILIFHRILLPRITQSSLTRHSLKSHHLSLLRRLTTSISSLKESQSKSVSVLPRPDPFKETLPYSVCKSLGDVLEVMSVEAKEPEISQLPTVTVLRCGLSDLAKDDVTENANPTTEELFRYLESKLSWLRSDKGSLYENQLRETLSSCPSFEKVSPRNASPDAPDFNSIDHWRYVPPAPPDPPPLLKSLHALLTTLSTDMKGPKISFQHTLQSLSDFTGYISTQVYLPYRPSSMLGLPGGSGQGKIEEEMRKEIRALKGLVLNRRSFMPSLIRNNAIPPSRAP